MIEIQYMVWLSRPSLQWQNPSLAQCQISQACALSRAALANADSESKTSCKLLGMPAMIWHPEVAVDTLSCHQYSHFDKSLGLWLLSSQCHWCPPTLRCDLCAKSDAALIAEFLDGLHSCTSWMRGWSRKILSSSQKNLKSLRSSHQNNVQSSLGTPCARSFIKSCIWVFAQAWSSECANDHQPFWKVLQKVVRSAQNAFNVGHCKQWRQGRQQEQQVGRKCLIQHIHNWSITPIAKGQVEWEDFQLFSSGQLRCLVHHVPEKVSSTRVASAQCCRLRSQRSVLLSFSKSLTSPLSAIGRYLVAHSQKRKHTAESSWVYRNLCESTEIHAKPFNFS